MPATFALRLQQTAVVVLGALGLGMLVWLGFWQLRIYHESGTRAAEARAARPPVALATVAQVGEPITEGFGLRVEVRGRYRPDLQLRVPLDGQPGQYRVLTALVTADGTVVPVVRGVLAAGVPPAPPTGVQDVVGVLLPSEQRADPPGNAAPDVLPSVRLPELAQRWPDRLIGGYVVLDADQVAASGLAPAPVPLPSASGRLRNGAYAMQWWLFAGFTAVMAVRMVIDLGRRAEVDALQDPQATGDGTGTDPGDDLPSEPGDEPAGTVSGRRGDLGPG